MNWNVSKNWLAILLAATLASACSAQRSLKHEVRSQSSETSADTMKEQSVVVVLDTLKEITTITLRESETGDTLRVTTVTDRIRASTRDRYHDVKEKVIVRTDTVYVEKQAQNTVAVAGSSTEITPDGIIRPRGVILKWVFFILLAVIALLIIFKTIKT